MPTPRVRAKNALLDNVYPSAFYVVHKTMYVNVQSAIIVTTRQAYFFLQLLPFSLPFEADDKTARLLGYSSIL